MQTLTRKSDEIIKHLTPKAIRCPECGSTDVVLGLPTAQDQRIFCQVCAAMVTVRREG